MKYIRVKEQIFIRETSRGDFLLVGQHVFEIDKIARAILELCDGKHTFEEIIFSLSRLYDDPREEIEKSVSQFLNTLMKDNIIIISENYSPIDPIYDYSRPSSINIEITYKCNESCKFCASNAGIPEKNEITDEEIDDLLDQIISLRISPVTITGGEPLLKKDLVIHMIKRIHEARLIPNLLTNGTLITSDLAQSLKNAGINYVQVSLDGSCSQTNDSIRGRFGGFNQALRGIHALKKANIDVSISSVLIKENFKELKSLYRLGEMLGVPISTAAVSPTGRGFDQELLLTSQQMCEHFCYTHLNEKDELNMLVLPRERCSIGTSPVVTPVGDVYPCMLTKYEQLKLGNVRESSLKTIWKTSSLLQELYQMTIEDLEPCETCLNKLFCGGGCRGHAFAYHGTIYKNDPYRCAANKLIIKEILKRGNKKTKKEVLELIKLQN